MDASTSDTSSEDKSSTELLKLSIKLPFDIDPFSEFKIQDLKLIWTICNIWAGMCHKQGVYVSFRQFYFIPVQLLHFHIHADKKKTARAGKIWKWSIVIGKTVIGIY